MIASLSTTGNLCRLRDASLDIWEGSLEILLVANFCFYLRKKTIYFFAMKVGQFFLCFVKEMNFFFRLVHSLLCTYHWVFFLVNIFFINFDNKLFYGSHFQQTFFSNFCGDDKLFSQFLSSPPPPPDIKWCVVKTSSALKPTVYWDEKDNDVNKCTSNK